MEQREFINKVVLITGGATGMGYAAAEIFLKKGAKVVIAGRRESTGLEAVEELKKISPEITFIQTDISSSAQVESLVNKTVERYGKLDIAFNNAGIEGVWNVIDQLTEEDFDNLIDINLKGTWLSCKYEIAQFKKQNSPGIIVNNSSWLSTGIMKGAGLYVASKAAIDSLTRALAVESAEFNIRVNSVNPGYILTPMPERTLDDDGKLHLSKHVPLGRWGEPSEVAELVVWLSSQSASYVTGQSILVDGGVNIPGQRW